MLPIHFGDLPAHLGGVNCWHVSTEELIIRPVLEKTEDYLYQVPLLDLLENAMLTVDSIIDPVDEVFITYDSVTKEYHEGRYQVKEEIQSRAAV